MAKPGGCRGCGEITCPLLRLDLAGAGAGAAAWAALGIRGALHQVPRPHAAGEGVGLGGFGVLPPSEAISAHGLHGGDGGALHLEALGGHLQGLRFILEPVLDGLHVGDALVGFIHVEGRGDHAGQAEAHLAPHAAHEFQRILCIVSVLIAPPLSGLWNQ